MSYAHARIIKTVAMQMAEEHSKSLVAVSKAATDYLATIAARSNSPEPAKQVAGVVIRFNGKPVHICDGFDVYPPVRVVTLLRTVMAKIGLDCAIDLDCTTSAGVALEAALVNMEEFMGRVHHAVRVLQIVTIGDKS
ncbi:MAG: hypothetical protein ACRC8Q_10805 [Aeromonas sp.]